jgi:hypothetical protein
VGVGALASSQAASPDSPLASGVVGAGQTGGAPSRETGSPPFAHTGTPPSAHS